MTPDPTRDRLVSVRLTDAEYDRLAVAASVHGCDRSTLLRTLIAAAPLHRVVWRQEPLPEFAALNDLSAVLRQRLAAEARGSD